MKKFDCLLSFVVIVTGLCAFAEPITVQSYNSGREEILIDCKIAGLDNKCLLDLGAPISSLAADFPAQSFTVLRQRERKAPKETDKPIICDVVAVPEFVSLGNSVKDYEMEICRTDTRRHQKESRIGLNFFKQPFTLSLKNADLSWAPTSPANVQLKPLQILSGGHLIVTVSLGGQDVGALYDTGSAYTAVDSVYADAHPEQFEFFMLSPVPAVDANGNRLQVKLYKVKALSINGVTLDGITLRGWDFGDGLRKYLGEKTPIILGLSDMTNATWYIDGINKQWAAF